MSFPKAMSAVFVLLAGSLACGQTRGPQEISVPVGRLASVPITLDADESDYVILGANVDGLREYDPDPKKLRLRVIGYEPGIAFVVVSSQKAGKLQPLFTVRVVVGAGPGPVPPGPVPVPPEPLDPLAKSIKEAAKADGFTKLKEFADGFRACNSLINRATTTTELQVSTKAALESAVGTEWRGKAPTLKAVLAKELSVLPETGTLTPDIKAMASGVFLSLAKACEGASK